MTEERDMMASFALLPHVKRALRLRTIHELEQTGYRERPTYVKAVRGKVKTQEWAKFGKLPRIIWDLKVPASLLGFVAPYIKSVLEIPYRENGGVVLFVPSVTTQKLATVFSDLTFREPVVSVIHSDDMCMGVDCVDGRLLLNVDIKSCDASHGPEIFDYFLELIGDGPFGAVCTTLVEQLKSEIILRNPIDPSEKFRYVAEQPVLFSGSTLTTIINTIATRVISLRFFFDLQFIPLQERSRERVCAQVLESARSCGYLVTCDVAHNAQQLLFLKHSPSASGVPFLAVGTILRSLTRYDGDVPGSRKLSLRARFEAHVRGVMEGHQHAGGHIITDALCERFRLPKFHSRVDDFDLCMRYGVDIWELRQLADIIRTLPFGVVVRSHVVDRILKVDYDACLAS